MLCYAMLCWICYVMLCYCYGNVIVIVLVLVMLCYVILRYVMLCYFMLCYVCVYIYIYIIIIYIYMIVNISKSPLSCACPRISHFPVPGVPAGPGSGITQIWPWVKTLVPGRYPKSWQLNEWYECLFMFIPPKYGEKIMFWLIMTSPQEHVIF